MLDYAAAAEERELQMTEANDSISNDTHTTVEATGPSFLNGVDISHFQGSVDFEKLKAAGIAFVFIKATEGGTLVDEKFAVYWKAAKAAGIPRGAYHFFRPKGSVQAQIANFVNTVGSLKVGDLPPVVDLEVPEDWANI
ncbi:MAG: glycoside hydrolase family 25 protein, partial [Cyanobacteria bacterium REEB67]|nr:glycoside hydrolase family 25 protein [Cyanobacteria bacterium REEB67]